MSDKEKKYLDDEQVKKKIDLKNDMVNISSGDKKENDTYIWVPTFLSLLLLLVYVIVVIYFYYKMGYFEELFNPGGGEGGGVAYLFAVIVFLPLAFSVPLRMTRQ